MVESIRQWEIVMHATGSWISQETCNVKDLRINETRITSAEYAKNAWGDEHVGALLISELHIEASKQRTAVAARILVMVTFHCIAGW